MPGLRRHAHGEIGGAHVETASGYEAAERAFCVTGAGAVRSRGVTTRKAPRVGAFFMRSWRDTFLAGAADATMRLIEVTASSTTSRCTAS